MDTRLETAAGTLHIDGEPVGTATLRVHVIPDKAVESYGLTDIETDEQYEGRGAFGFRFDDPMVAVAFMAACHPEWIKKDM